MRNPKSSQREAPVTVTFPIPRRAASKLRTMAVSRDRRLLDLGVLAVQINEGESIVLGIKLGNQRIKKTEVSSEKIRANANRGRVKKPSTCRNVATIHHLPNALSSQAPRKLQAGKTANFSLDDGEEKTRRVSQLDGDVVGHNLFNDLNKTSSKPSNNNCKFHLSDFTTSCASGLLLNGQSSSTRLSSPPHQHTNKQQSNSNYALGDGVISQGSNMQMTIEKPSTSPAVVTSRKASDESHLSSARTLSSPASQRTCSASPCSDASSASSEENFDVEYEQLIYSCFVDRSKYSAAEMLKELAKTHTAKKSTAITGSKVPGAVKTRGGPRRSDTQVTAASTKSSSGRSSLQQEQSTVLDDSERSNIAGSYRDHVRNIRCNSLASLTTCTSMVNASMKMPVSPASSTDQSLGFQNSTSSNKKPSSFGDVTTASHPVQHTLQHTTLSTALQTDNLKANTSETATYHGGRKVLWSSSNAFPRIPTSLANFPINISSAVFPQLNSSCSANVTFPSQVQEVTETSSCMRGNRTTCNDAIKSTVTETCYSNQDSMKLAGKELANDIVAIQSDSKTVVDRTPSLSFVSKESVTAQNTSPHTAVSTSSDSFSQVTNVVQKEHASTAQVQNLTMGRPTIPAPVVVAGSNTQTTWSNQQVSPTYFVGAQGQYGIYSALYSPDVNNNQLGQQAVAAAYPLNYVYPVSFVYPYLAMAQLANNMKSSLGENSKQQSRSAEVTQTDALISTAKTAKAEPTCNVDTKESTGTTASPQPVASSAASAPTQFIDLASSMRYWQQLSMLYRSRLQALASCNLSNVSAVSSSQNSTTSSATSAAKCTESLVVVANEETSVKSSKSNSEEQSLFKMEISQENMSTQLYTQKMPIDDSSKENICSALLQHTKPEINLQEGSGSKDTVTGDRPSVIVAASSKENWDSGSETLISPVTVQCKQEETDNSEGDGSDSVLYRTSPTKEVFSAQLHLDRLRHMDEDDMGESMPTGLTRNFYGSPPKLSFVHDSSIAYVNVGNRNGNGFGSSTGSYTGAKKTAFGTQLDTAVRPAKRRKSKKSL